MIFYSFLIRFGPILKLVTHFITKLKSVIGDLAFNMLLLGHAYKTASTIFYIYAQNHLSMSH